MNETLQHNAAVRTARIAGIWYLMLAITGIVGFLALHSRVYDSDPATTLANITGHLTRARIRLLFELLIVLSQALAAVWFYKLFRDIRHDAAWALAAWGMVNAVAILISAIGMAGTIAAATGTHGPDDKLVMIQVFSLLIKHAWGAGSLFFGLWLIPMGYVVVSSQRMPMWLGRVLILGGVGYIANTFINYLGVTDAWVSVLTVPATIGEFWMITYLLIFGIRPERG